MYVGVLDTIQLAIVSYHKTYHSACSVIASTVCTLPMAAWFHEFYNFACLNVLLTRKII